MRPSRQERRELIEQFAQGGAAPETGFLANVGAAYEATRLEFGDDALERLVREDLETNATVLAGLTGEPNRWHYSTGPWGSFETSALLRQMEDADEDIQRFREQGIPGAEILKTHGEIIEGMRSRVDAARQARNQADERATLGGKVGGFVGMLGAGAADVSAVLTLPFGAARGFGVLRAALAEGAVNAAVEATLAPSRGRMAEAMGEERTAGDVLGDLGIAFGAGAGLGAGFRAVGKGAERLARRLDPAFGEITAEEATAAVKKGIEKGVLDSTPERVAAIRAVEDAINLAESNHIGDGNLHLRATDQSVRAVTDGRIPEIDRLYGDIVGRTLVARRGLTDFLDRVATGRPLDAAEAEPARAVGDFTSDDLAAIDELDTLVRERVAEIGGEPTAALRRVQRELGVVGQFRRLRDNLREANRYTPEAEAWADRVQRGAILHRSTAGNVVPFKTRKGAREFAAKSLRERYEAVKVGRGWGLVPEETPITRQMRADAEGVSPRPLTRDVEAAAQTQHDANVDVLRRARDVEAMSPEAVEMRRLVMSDEELDSALARAVEEDPDLLVVSGLDEAGNPLVRRLADAMDELDAEEDAVKALTGCILGQ